MLVAAAARLIDVLSRQRDVGSEVRFKITNDPRLTKVGKFIRRFSLATLPQLLNVLLGRMSLVGPRSPLMHEVQMYGLDARHRLLVKPGLARLW